MELFSEFFVGTLQQMIYILWKRIGVMVCKKSAHPNCSVALTNCSGTLISVPEHL